MVHDQTPVKTVNIIDMPWIELQCLFNNTVLPIPTDFSKYTSTSNHPIIATPQPLPHFDTTGCQILMSLDHQVCLATYVFRASLVGRFIQPVKVEHEDGIGIHDSWTEGPFWRFPKLSVLGTTVVFPSRRISLTKIGRDAVIIFEQLLIWCDIEMINTLYKENTHIQELYLPVMLCLPSRKLSNSVSISGGRELWIFLLTCRLLWVHQFEVMGFLQKSRNLWSPFGETHRFFPMRLFFFHVSRLIPWRLWYLIFFAKSIVWHCKFPVRSSITCRMVMW